MIMKNFILILLCFSIIHSSIYSQNKLENGFPLVNNYSPKEYGADTQNWAIMQDERGIMYFGNNLGLLEFDGVDWRLYPMPNNTTVRSLALGNDGKIYTGGVGDLGYYLPDSLGNLSFHSLLDFVPIENRDISDSVLNSLKDLFAKDAAGINKEDTDTLAKVVFDFVIEEVEKTD
jgi:hypothetical protein